MNIEIARGDALGESHRRQISDVLVNGFAEDFEYFSKNPQTLAGAFAHMIILERFFVALVDGEPAAIASVTEGDQECFAPDRHEMQRTLGWFHGLISFAIVRSQFLGAYPGARPGLAEIGFVTTAPQHQGKGVATALMTHLLELPYDEFVLRDIKDTNAPALGLYRKLGFTVSDTRPVKFAARAGFSTYVSMSLAKTTTRS
ncbi:GNAT family N-acetyltransferase [Microbacterium esteraromaticum]|uniref:GNAT family N-acetyltransferase n=1 Tax=Microbacterium esteraromaticum TaxID=57043 RepID=A0A939IST3_9MICO|nr:GNAT family N-acetyltransferase [Microbacterium esteraromaticum]MBN8205492.1 GNAT family N-acetyltransferase [Microbacterium esteraromaticum]MBN8415646.1 GNAT family N-acetyltransferase [Microbacterium esteraromaticum]